MIKSKNPCIRGICLIVFILLAGSAAGCGAKERHADHIGGKNSATPTESTTIPTESITVPMENITIPTENTTVSLETARQTALKDAGVSAENAVFTKEKTDYENGQQVYELEFYTSDGEYEYEIKVSDGTVYSKETKIFQQGTSPSANGNSIDLEQAKAIAISHAKADAQDVIFKEAEFDREHGVEVYEIEFYFSGREYEYKIRVSDGSILEYEKK